MKKNAANPADRYLQWINAYAQKTAPLGEPSSLYKPIQYTLALGGKRLRPILVLMSYALYKNDVKKILPYAMAVEIFHNFTLIHDDIMDNAPLRRKKPTVHVKWGVNAAILSGDVMLINAYQRLLSLPTDKLPKILKMFNQCALQVCEGQQWDMMYENSEFISPEEYLNMIMLKTAVLLGFSMELGASLAGASPADSKRLRQVGIDLGMAFQLADDRLDAFGGKSFGKQIGGDIIANKKTFLLTQAWQRANTAQRVTLKKCLVGADMTSREKMQTVLQLYQTLQISEITQIQTERYFRQAFQSLEKINANSRQKQVLTNYMKELKNRAV